MMNENEIPGEITAPSMKTVKRLFAESGNKCAFPKCANVLIEGDTVVGKICHIKARKPGGPRYDPNQTSAERHGYDNLILLCGTHHPVIDDDEEAYTVDRLLRMKRNHKDAANSMSEQFVNHATALLMDNSVNTSNQSGGIAAHSVVIHHNYASPSESSSVPSPSPKGFAAAQPQAGQSRFRAPDKPLGVHWQSFSFVDHVEPEIFLSKGPAVWLRVMPTTEKRQNWSAIELRKAATYGNLSGCSRFSLASLNYLRAEDGFGIYSSMGLH